MAGWHAPGAMRRGRVIAPDPQRLYPDQSGSNRSAHYGIAQTRRGRIAVYRGKGHPPITAEQIEKDHCGKGNPEIRTPGRCQPPPDWTGTRVVVVVAVIGYLPAALGPREAGSGGASAKDKATTVEAPYPSRHVTVLDRASYQALRWDAFEIDAPMFCQGFSLARIRRVCFLLMGGHDREGPLLAEGRLLSGHEVSSWRWARGGPADRSQASTGCGSRLAGQAAPGATASAAGAQVVVDLAGDVTLQAADDLLLGEPFLGAPLDVGAGGGVGAHPGDDDPP